MATIYNSNLTKELIDVAKLQTSRDIIPSQIADKVVPVIDVNPKHSRNSQIIRQISASNVTSGTIYTTPSDRDFYLTSIILSMIKDATSTSTYSTISCYVDGVNQILAVISGFTLTADSQTITNNYAYSPIKVDKGTAITVTNQTNNANITSRGSITGFVVDNSNA